MFRSQSGCLCNTICLYSKFRAGLRPFIWIRKDSDKLTIKQASRFLETTTFLFFSTNSLSNYSLKRLFSTNSPGGRPQQLNYHVRSTDIVQSEGELPFSAAGSNVLIESTIQTTGAGINNLNHNGIIKTHRTDHKNLLTVGFHIKLDSSEKNQ